MPECRVERTLPDDLVLGLILDRAKRESAKWGSTFEGDLQRGAFRMKTPLGPVEGTYVAQERVIAFTIERKPRLVPCALIERILDEFLRA